MNLFNTRSFNDLSKNEKEDLLIKFDKHYGNDSLFKTLSKKTKEDIILELKKKKYKLKQKNKNEDPFTLNEFILVMNNFPFYFWDWNDDYMGYRKQKHYIECIKNEPAFSELAKKICKIIKDLDIKD